MIAALVGAVRTRRSVELTLVAVLFVLATVYFTWPVATQFGSTTYALPGDALGASAYFRELVDSGQSPFLPGTLFNWAAPEGVPITWALNLAGIGGNGTLWLLTSGLGQVIALNVFTFVGYVATGVMAYAFVRWAGGSPVPAFMAGWACAFWPFALVNGLGHLDYIQTWVLIAAIWAVFWLADAPSWRRGVVASVVIALALVWTPYFILLGGTAVVAGLAYLLLRAIRRHAVRAFIGAAALALAVPLAVLAALKALAAIAGPEAGTTRSHDISSALAFSARPWEYLMPSAQNPVAGDWANAFFAAHMHGSNPSESLLYVGVILTAFALVGIVVSWVPRWTPEGRLAMVGRGATVIAVAAGLLSLQPEVVIGGHTIHLPSWYLFNIAPTWRAYSRLAIVVMVAVATLAAIAITVVIRRLRPRVGVALALVALALVALDFGGRIGTQPTDVAATPRVYDVLRAQPDGIAAEFPFGPAGTGYYLDLFYRPRGGKPLANGFLEGTVQERRMLGVARLDSMGEIERLNALGIRYVINHAGPVAAPTIAQGTPRGLERLYEDQTVGLYRVPTVRGAVLFTPWTGFGLSEQSAAGPGAWLGAPTGIVDLLGSCNPCRGTVSVRITSFAQPRQVAITDPNGRVVFRGRIGVTPRRISFPLTFPGSGTLTVRADPGPESIAARTGTPDPRSVSVFAGPWRFASSR